MIEVVTGNTPRNIRVSLPYVTRVFIAQCEKRLVDATDAPGLGALSLHLFFACPAQLHSRSVIQEHFQTFGIAGHRARHLGMHATRVVAQHASESAVIVGCRIWTEGQAVFSGGIAEIVENAA